MFKKLLAAGLLVMVACRPAPPPSSKPAPPPSPKAAEPIPPPEPPLPPPPAPAPAKVERLLVPGDLPASIVRSLANTPPLTVFLPGMCSNANAYLHTFPEAARAQGGVLAIEGDQPCGNAEGFHSFSWDAARLHARIEAGLAATGLVEIPREGITLIGYSQGASLAEQLVERWPSRYTRLVLIAAPTDPAARKLARARSVVTMSCSRDVPARMKQAADATTKAGTPATYVEMPNCTHGNVTDGERVFGTSFEWLRTNERPVGASAERVRIAGPDPRG